MPRRIFEGMYENWRRAMLEWLGQVCCLLGVGMFALALLRLSERRAAEPDVWIFVAVGLAGLVAAYLLIALAGRRT